MPSLTVRPGVFVRLKKQPDDLPDFLVESCVGERCWIRQLSWAKHIQMQIKVTQIDIANSQTQVDASSCFPHAV